MSSRFALLVIGLVGCNSPRVESTDAPSSALAPDLSAAAAERGWPEVLPGQRTAHRTLVSAGLDGVPIVGVGGAVSESQEASLTGIRLELADPPPARQITASNAELIALRSTGATTIVSSEPILVPEIESRLIAAVSGRPVTATDYERVVHHLRSAWQVIASDGSGRKYLVRIDAVTGDVVTSRSLAPSAFGDASIHSHHYGTRTMLAYNDGAEYPTTTLRDPHGNTVEGPNGGQYTNDDTPPTFGDGLPYTSGNPMDVNGESAAADAYVATDVIWTMYENVLGMPGPLGGDAFRVVVHHPNDANSSWDHDSRTVDVGYVSLVAYPLVPLSVIDVIGHEVGHGYLRYATGLPQWQAEDLGGIDEATGDMFGTAAENYRKVAWGEHTGVPLDSIPIDGNFEIGEATGHTYRSMRTPEVPVWYPQIDTDVSPDDVHRRLGPYDRMFYILATGLDPVPATGYTGNERTSQCLPGGMSGIGIANAIRLWASTVPRFVWGDSWTEARDHAIAAAGIDYPTKRAVANAFAAVCIGTAAPTEVPAFTAPVSQVGQAMQVDVEFPFNTTWTGTLDLVIDSVRYQSSRASITPFLRQFRFTQSIELLASGKHTFTVAAQDGWGNTLQVSKIVVVDHAGPTQALAVSGTNPKIRTVTSTVSDPAGIQGVEFLADGTSFGTDLTSPYAATFDTSTWTDGTHVITARAYDTLGNVTTSTVGLTADNTAPVPTLTTSAISPFTVTATGTDTHPLTGATFTLDGVTLATDNTPPFSTTWAPQDANPHMLGVKLRDSYGNEGTTSILAPRDTIGPSETLSAQQWGYGVTLSATASDPCGIATPTMVLVDGIVIAQPAAATWTGALPSSLFSAGQHVLSMTASDHCGNTRTTNQPFWIYLNVPIVVATVEEGADKKHPIIHATVTHNRPIDHVELYRQFNDTGTSAFVGNDTTAPYTFTLDTSSWESGTYTVQVTAVDNVGMPGSAYVTVVADNTPPAVGFTWTWLGGHNFEFDANPSDGTGSGVVDVHMAAVPVTTFSGIDYPHPPYRLNITVGSNETDIWAATTATDAYGNEGTDGIVLHLSCPSRSQCNVTVVPFQ
jgi:Zn-dependent metalloprotease